MSASHNITFSLCGNLTRDARKTITKNGRHLTFITVAVNTRRQDENGDWQDHAEFFEVGLRSAEEARKADFLTKGRRVELLNTRFQVNPVFQTYKHKETGEMVEKEDLQFWTSMRNVNLVGPNRQTSDETTDESVPF